jgi:hypothetical protein
MRALDHPAPRLAEDATDHGRLTATADVRDDPALSDAHRDRAAPWRTLGCGSEIGRGAVFAIRLPLHTRSGSEPR